MTLRPALISQAAQHPLSRALAVTSSKSWDADTRMPMVPAKGHGAHFWDVGGRQMIDLTSCTGAAPLGMSYRPVIEAMIAELDSSGGVLPGTINELRTATAELLVSVYPCADRALFFRTGSCATSGAVRLARVFTGRGLILSSGFHGWHDWQLQYKGSPDVTGRDAGCIDFGYDLERLRELLASYAGEVAAVFVTPEVTCMPLEDLATMARLASEHDVLFMLDEIITGSRFQGGLHRELGLQPDVITVSKGLCNGAALSAVLGRREVLLAQEKTYLGNTYMREVTPFAGALTTLRQLHEQGAIGQMAASAQMLAGHLNAEFRAAGLGAAALQNGGVFHILFDDDETGEGFYAALRAGGVHAEHRGTHLPTAALTKGDLAILKERMSRAVTRTAEARQHDTDVGSTGISQQAFARFTWNAFRADRGVSDRWWAAHPALGDDAA